jgi:hypothetical protein
MERQKKATFQKREWQEPRGTSPNLTFYLVFCRRARRGPFRERRKKPEPGSMETPQTSTFDLIFLQKRRNAPIVVSREPEESSTSSDSTPRPIMQLF